MPAATHLDFAIVGRTRPGRTDQGSAVAAAAYNACARFAHDGRAFDFTHKAREHIGQIVLLPPGSSPAFTDPEILWRAAEDAERRGDAQTARQVLIAIPRDVPEDLRLPLIRAIADPWVDDGMAAQVDVHNVQAADGQEQPHAHILLSLRRMTDAGFAKIKERRWNTEFRTGEGRAMRAEIERRGNNFLALHGLPALLNYNRRSADDIPPEPSAPRPDWQRWKRAGAHQEAAPPTVAAVLDHRQRRIRLARASDDATAAAAEVAELERQLSVVERPYEGHRPLPRPTPPISPAPLAVTQPAPQAPQHQEDDIMPKKPTTTDRKPQHEPWMDRLGGLDALSPAHQSSALKSYDTWAKKHPAKAEDLSMEKYVAFVQRRHAMEREQAQIREEAEAAQRPTAVGPDEPFRRTRERVTRQAAEFLSSERPAGLPNGWQARHNPATGATHLRGPDGSRVVDHGDRLEPAPGTDPDQLLDLAVSKGWASLKLEGNDNFKSSVARAAALREPPIATDHPLPADAQREVSAALAERAASRVAPLDGAAVRTAAAIDPAAAARTVLDQRETRARATLAGRPSGETDPTTLARPRIADLLDRREEAREAAEEARKAASAHRDEHGWAARMLDPSARRRQAALDDEAQRLDRESRGLERGYDRSVSRIEKEASRQARDNRRGYDDWKWNPSTRKAEGQLRDLAALRKAVDEGSPEVTEAVIRGAFREAGKALPAWQAAGLDRAREAEERRQQAAEQAVQQAERNRRETETPKGTAIRLALDNEKEAGTDLEALKRARVVTAAIVGDDDDTIAAITTHGAEAPATHAAAAAFKEAAESGLSKINGIVMGRVSEAAGMSM